MDEDGFLCPLTNYLQFTVDPYHQYDENEMASYKLSSIGSDCRSSQCNARMLTLFDTMKVLNDNGANITNDLYDAVKDHYSHYVDQTCNEIDNYDPSRIEDITGLGTPSEQCEQEFSKYSECVSQFNSLDTLNQEGVKTMCEIMDSSVCKGFRDDLATVKSVCFDSGVNNFVDMLYGMSLITYKIQYQMFCAKDNQGNLCPLTEYLFNAVDDEDLEEETSNGPTQEQLEVIANDCRNASCNARMILISDYTEYMKNTMENAPLIEQAMRTQNSPLLGQVLSMKNSPLLGQVLSMKNTPLLGQVLGNKREESDILMNYVEHYKTGKCSEIDGSDPQFDTIKDDNKYSSDASTMKRMSLSILMMVILSSLFLF